MGGGSSGQTHAPRVARRCPPGPGGSGCVGEHLPSSPAASARPPCSCAASGGGWGLAFGWTNSLESDVCPANKTSRWGPALCVYFSLFTVTVFRLRCNFLFVLQRPGSPAAASRWAVGVAAVGAAGGTWASGGDRPAQETKWRPVASVVTRQPPGQAGLLPAPAAAGGARGCQRGRSRAGGLGSRRAGGAAPPLPASGSWVALPSRPGSAAGFRCVGDEASRGPRFQGLLTAGPSSLGLSSLVLGNSSGLGPFWGRRPSQVPWGLPVWLSHQQSACMGVLRTGRALGAARGLPGGPETPAVLLPSLARSFPRLPREAWSRGGGGLQDPAWRAGGPGPEETGALGPGQDGRGQQGPGVGVLDAGEGCSEEGMLGCEEGPRAPGPAGRAVVPGWSPRVPLGCASRRGSRPSRLAGRGTWERPRHLRAARPRTPAAGSGLVPGPRAGRAARRGRRLAGG